MVGFYFNQSQTITEQDKLDYAQAKSYLQLVSKTLNKGTNQVNYLNAINKAGMQVDYLKEINNAWEIAEKDPLPEKNSLLKDVYFES